LEEYRGRYRCCDVTVTVTVTVNLSLNLTLTLTLTVVDMCHLIWHNHETMPFAIYLTEAR
jgi:hypothetical protein